jgi:transporter family-2 protein
LSSGLTSVAIVAVGIQLALQAPINSALGRHAGRLGATLVSFAVGTVALLALVIITGQISEVHEFGEVPVHQLAGGLIGATYVAVSTLTVARIGAGAVVAATITGQLLSSLLIDDLGLIGVDAVPLDALRIGGAVLLIAGTLAVVGRDRLVDPESGVRGGRFDLPAVAAVFVAGLLVGIQHPLNSLLSDSAGELLAALSNFVVGLVLLAALVLATGRAARLTSVSQAPLWQFLGGLIGVITVIAALSAVSAIGAAGLTAALVTGQLIGSLAIDRAGAFGLEVRPITVRRACGVLLLLVGTALCIS